MKYLPGYTLEEFRKDLENSGFEPYRADQVFNWLYKRGEEDFGAMTNLPKGLRQLLASRYTASSLSLIESIKAPDSEKFLFRTRDGQTVETVLIKERDHNTLCVSSQIGCAVGCRFCATAIDGLVRNLKTEEIVDQYLKVRKITSEDIRNVVFMGMGEPLANIKNVRKAVEILISRWGLDLSKRRVTISTSGLVSGIRKMAEDPLLREVNLAVSINSPFEEERSRLMPLMREGSLEELMEELKSFPLKPYRKITLEYVLLSGLNDTQDHAKALASLIGTSKKRFKVNLIPYNPVPDLPFARPSIKKILEFQRTLWDRGISTFVRFSKGIQTFGACGQLRASRSYAKISNQ